MADINQQFKGFNDNFYNDRANAYKAYAEPVAMQQFRDTKNNLAYALARGGLLNSGAAVTGNQSLNRELSRTQSDIANAGQSEANQLRGQVQDQRTAITNQLVASGDPSIANESAVSATANLRAPTAFQPLGNYFSDWTNAYLANRNQSASTPGTPSLWNMLSGGGGSSTIVQ